MKTKTKPKPKTLFANDLKVTSPDGEELYPHYGEFVMVRRAATVAEGILSDRKITERTSDDVLRALASRLIAWSWTDETGRPLPAPTIEVLGQCLDYNELFWLQMAVAGKAGVETNEDPLESSAASTDGSTTTTNGQEARPMSDG